MIKSEVTFDANKFRGPWVAFRPNTEEVVASGPTLEAAIHDAAEQGVDDPEFYRVPNSDAYFIGGV